MADEETDQMVQPSDEETDQVKLSYTYILMKNTNLYLENILGNCGRNTRRGG